MKKSLILIACVLGFVLTVTNTLAATITLSLPPTGNYVGTIVDSIPSSGAVELGYVQDMLLVPIGVKDDIGTIDFTGDSDTGQTEIYDRLLSNLTTLPPALTFIDKDDTGSNHWTVNTDDPFYILGKYDADKAGALVWLVDASIGDVIDLPTGFGANKNGQPYALSHISAFSTTTTLVPEPGTMMLLGSGLVGLAGWGRKKFRK